MKPLRIHNVAEYELGFSEQRVSASFAIPSLRELPIIENQQQKNPGVEKVTKKKREKSEWEKRLGKGKRMESREKRKIKRSKEIKARLSTYRGMMALTS